MTVELLKKGRSLLKSGFVENVQDRENADTYFVRNHVHHFMNNNVTAMTSKMSGFIKNRTYTCRPSALGRCDHVTALLHLLNNFISEKGYIVHSLSTSKSCTRNKGERRLKHHKEVNNDSTHTFKEKKLYICIYYHHGLF